MSTLPQAARERKRAEELERIPSWYNPWLHLAGTTGVGIVTLVIAVLNIQAVRPVEWLTIPAVFLFANFFEWRVHKYVLHRRFWPLEYIYQQHTPMHHGIYVTEDMTMRSRREFRLVLIPALGVLSIVVAAAPPAVVLGMLLTPNTGWLYLVTASTYMVLYELTHLSYHLAEDSFIGRMRIIRFLRHHHALHHDPRLMQGWNFNVTVPLFDWILGTYYRSDECRATSDEN